MRRPPTTSSTDKGIGSLKHIDVAYLWMHDEVRSGCVVRRVKSEENVADRGSKPLSKRLRKHCFALRCVNMAEESVWCRLQDVAMFWGLRFGSQLAAAASR